MIKIIWGLIAFNAIALLVFIAAYFIINSGKNPDYQEKGWTFILVIIGLIIILLQGVSLHFSHTTVSQVLSGLFAALPLVIGLSIYASNKLPSLKKKSTFAETYYKDKKQRAIASAIEQNDTTLLKQLIKGQDLDIQGTRVWNQDGLNYLQFAIRIRSNPISFPYNEKVNDQMIRILIEHSSPTTPALADGVNYLSIEMISLLLDEGADPNFFKHKPLFFSVIGNTKKQNDIAILLLKKGADANAKNEDNFTPVMYAALNAGFGWADSWRVVRHLLEDSNADYNHTLADGRNLASIIRNIRMDADGKKKDLPEDFIKVVEWLKQHGIDTDPVKV